jgi:hypothetical protein
MSTLVVPWALSGFLAVVVCALPAAAQSDQWQDLFDGRTLNGWRAAENPASFRVTNGVLVADGPRAHLFYVGPNGDASFGSFEFEAQVMTQPDADSGVYFHTGWQERDRPRRGHEVQIRNRPTGAPGGVREHRLTGSLFGVRNVYKPFVPDHEWFRVRIVVRGPAIQVWVNEVQTVDYVGRTAGRGTFALQCESPGRPVFFRHLRVRPLPEPVAAPPPTPEVETDLAWLHAGNYPVIDLHTHLKGGLTLAEVLQRQYRTGINAGVAVNCGLGFAITNDAGIDRALEELRHPLVWVAMQAEGREWLDLFSPAAIARFDYVFTDAMTFSDERGRRMRLWIPDEVQVEDPQRFMDLLVARTVSILENEPIDIWVNPTYLPEVLAADYDRLWTRERRQRVIEAAVRHGVAIEINDRFRLPSAAFIREARLQGAKFTLGTNNGGREDLGALRHSVRMVRECGLEWSDFWVPGQQPSRMQRLLRGGARLPR